MIYLPEQLGMERRKIDRRKNKPAEGELSLPDLIGIVYKRLWLVVLITAIPPVATYVHLSKIPRFYGAKASVLLETQEVNLADFPDVLSSVTFDNLTVPTEVQVISSPALIKETIAALGLRADQRGILSGPNVSDSVEAEDAKTPPGAHEYLTLKAFMDMLDVKQQGTSRVIDIAFRSADPRLAADIVNAHARQYVLSKQREKRNLAERIDRWLTEQIAALKDQNLKKAREVQQFRAQRGMVQSENSRELIYQQISDLSKKITETDSLLLDLQARNETLQSGDLHGLPDVVSSPLIQSFKTQASVAAQNLQSLRGKYGERHPEVVAAREQLMQINNDIAHEVANIKKSVLNELTSVRKQKALLEGNLQKLQQESSALQEKLISLQALQLEEQASRKLLDNLLARSEQIKSQIDFTRPDVSVVSTADMPYEPLGSKTLLILFGVLAFSGFVALVVVFLLEISKAGVRTREDIQKLSAFELIGTLPRTRLPISDIINKERSLFIEEIKRLFIHINAVNRGKTILFTASRRGEGKSTLAAAVAYYMNNLGLKTLLIDADTIDPVIAGVTMIPSSPGLSEVLAGRVPPERAISRDRHGLYILPAGERTPYISDLILSGKLETHLAEMKAQFDFIIFDCASALNLSDAEVISSQVDQTVVVLEWARTPREEFMKTVDILRRTSKNPPCVVLNKIKMSEMESFRVY